jgi:hypothetical protein
VAVRLLRCPANGANHNLYDVFLLDDNPSTAFWRKTTRWRKAPCNATDEGTHCGRKWAFNVHLFFCGVVGAFYG